MSIPELCPDCGARLMTEEPMTVTRLDEVKVVQVVRCTRFYKAGQGTNQRCRWTLVIDGSNTEAVGVNHGS